MKVKVKITLEIIHSEIEVPDSFEDKMNDDYFKRSLSYILENRHDELREIIMVKLKLVLVDYL